jgi:8-oxo-dGTP pyrophosphatase MutT (NUDIX family)
VIRAEIDEGVFSVRVAGVFIVDGNILVHQAVGDDFCILPGGRVEMFEETSAALVREMKEELDADVCAGRLLWVCENFFEYGGDQVHELCFYYQSRFMNPAQIPAVGSFWRQELDGSDLEFTWLPLSQVKTSVIYPRFLNDGLLALPTETTRIVAREY